MHPRVNGRRRSPEGVHAAVRVQTPVFVPPVGELNGIQLRLQPDFRPELRHRFHHIRLFRHPGEREHRNAEGEPVGVAGLRQQRPGPLRVIPVQLVPPALPFRVVPGGEIRHQSGDPLPPARALENGFVNLVPVQRLVHRHADQLAAFPRIVPGHHLVPRRHNVVALPDRLLLLGGHIRGHALVAGGEVHPAKDGESGLRRNRAVKNFQPVVNGVLQQRPVDGGNVAFPRLHNRQPRRRFPHILDLNFPEVRVHPPVVVVHPFPQPALAFRKATELVGARAGRVFINRVPALLAVPQRRPGLGLPVVRLPVGASLIPLRPAADGNPAIAGEPVEEIHRRPQLHMNVDFVVVDDLNLAARIRPEVVGVRRPALRVGVVIQGMHHIIGGEFPPPVLPGHALPQLEVPGAPVRGNAPLRGQHRLVRTVQPTGIHHKFRRHPVVHHPGAGDLAVQHGFQRRRVQHGNQPVGDQLPFPRLHRRQGRPGGSRQHRSPLRRRGRQRGVRRRRRIGGPHRSGRRRIGRRHGRRLLSRRRRLRSRRRLRRRRHILRCAAATDNHRRNGQRRQQREHGKSQKPSIHSQNALRIRVDFANPAPPAQASSCRPHR